MKVNISNLDLGTLLFLYEFLRERKKWSDLFSFDEQEEILEELSEEIRSRIFKNYSPYEESKDVTDRMGQ